MTIETEAELRLAYEQVTKMYQIKDRLAADTHGHASTRADEIESVVMMIRKLERQIAAYLTAHPERAA